MTGNLGHLPKCADGAMSSHQKRFRSGSNFWLNFAVSHFYPFLDLVNH